MREGISSRHLGLMLLFVWSRRINQAGGSGEAG